MYIGIIQIQYRADAKNPHIAPLNSTDAYNNTASVDPRRDLDRAPLPVHMRHAVAPTHALGPPAVPAGIVDVDLGEAELVARGLDGFHSSGQLSSAAAFGGRTAVLGLEVACRLPLDDLFLGEAGNGVARRQDHLRVRYALVGGQ